MGENGVALEELKKRMAEFTRERDWDQFHSPRNLLLALVGEVGELSEIFRWRGEVARGLPGWKEEERQHLGEDIAVCAGCRIPMSFARLDGSLGIRP